MQCVQTKLINKIGSTAATTLSEKRWPIVHNCSVHIDMRFAKYHKVVNCWAIQWSCQREEFEDHIGFNDDKDVYGNKIIFLIFYIISMYTFIILTTI